MEVGSKGKPGTGQYMYNTRSLLRGRRPSQTCSEMSSAMRRHLSWRFRFLAALVLLFTFTLPLSMCFSTESSSVAATSRATRMKPVQSKVTYNSRIQYKQSPEDDFFRSLRQKTPPKFQYFLRDSGLLRFLVDTLTLISAVPAIARKHPEAVARYVHLSGVPSALVSVASAIWKPTEGKGVEDSLQTMAVDAAQAVEFVNLRYGRHSRQSVDVMKLKDESSASSSLVPGNTASSRLVLFVHGGAWGSGTKEVYRVAASPFLERGTTVAVLGYRTYPDGNVPNQVEDIREAIRTLREKGLIGTHTILTLMGHSSGSHISCLALVSDSELRQAVTCFVALAGVYDIPSHYRYERLRGVERFSPMSVACAETSGPLLQAWKRQSPTWVLQSSKGKLENFPKTLVFHGQEDTTVPTESAIRFAESLREKVEVGTGDVDLLVQPDTGHVDVMTQLMFGGTSRDAVLSWMETKGAIAMPSKP